MSTVLTTPLPPRFSLPHTVCSYGFFVLAPSRWDPRPRKLAIHRPLRLRGGEVVQAVITQRGERLRITLSPSIDRAERSVIIAQVRRILRLDESFDVWHRLNPAARRGRFDRLFRSPTLFEDIVKTFTSCNVTWAQTIRMNELLCRHVGTGGDFPSPPEMARWAPGKLAEVCRVGYRAERMIRLARDVEAGRLDLAWFEQPQRTTDELYEALRKIHGAGPYAAANILQLLGHYDRLAVDSELVRHFAEVHGRTGDLKRITAAAIEHYRHYAPYQFLAYWFEIWGSYEQRFGKAQQWDEKASANLTAPSQ